jgi:hypothetical protein
MGGRIMKSLKRLLNNKDGGFSILFVILIFIGIIVMVGFLDITVRSYTINELQSNMDVSGVSSLQSGIDKTKLRVEIFDVDKHIVEANYKKMISERLNEAENIESFHFIKTDVETFNSDFGLGKSSKTRPQALLDSTIVIVVDNSQMFDLVPGSYKMYYDSKSSDYFEIQYNGKTDDGKVELIVRSVSRLVYR